MQADDFDRFSDAWGGAWETVGRNITARAIVMAFELLREFELGAIERVLMVHAHRSRNPPMVADIREALEALVPGGHPGPDEAWGIVAQILDNESETAVLTGEMREAWGACLPVAELGDKIGARRTFIETYERLMAAAKVARSRPVWEPLLGTDPAKRALACEAAIQAGRLRPERVAGWLPALPPAGGGVLALLEHQSGQEDGGAADAAQAAALRDLRALLERLDQREKDEQERARVERAEQLVRERAAREAYVDGLLQQAGYVGEVPSMFEAAERMRAEVVAQERAA